MSDTNSRLTVNKIDDGETKSHRPRPAVVRRLASRSSSRSHARRKRRAWIAVCVGLLACVAAFIAANYLSPLQVAWFTASPLSETTDADLDSPSTNTFVSGRRIHTGKNITAVQSVMDLEEAFDSLDPTEEDVAPYNLPDIPSDDIDVNVYHAEEEEAKEAKEADEFLAQLGPLEEDFQSADVLATSADEQLALETYAAGSFPILPPHLTNSTPATLSSPDTEHAHGAAQQPSDQLPPTTTPQLDDTQYVVAESHAAPNLAIANFSESIGSDSAEEIASQVETVVAASEPSVMHIQRDHSHVEVHETPSLDRSTIDVAKIERSQVSRRVEHKGPQIPTAIDSFAADVQSALEDYRAKRKALKTGAGEHRVLARAYYGAAANLCELATKTQTAPAAILSEIQQISADPDLLKLASSASHSWIGWSKRTTSGVLVAGTLEKAEGTDTGNVLSIRTRDKRASVVRVLVPFDQAANNLHGKQLIVLARIIDGQALLHGLVCE